MKQRSKILSFGIFSAIVASVVISTNLNAQTPKKPEKEETKLESLANFTRVITAVESSYADELTFSEINDKLRCTLWLFR